MAMITAPKNTSYFGVDIAISGNELLVASWENTFSYQMICVEDQDALFV